MRGVGLFAFRLDLQGPLFQLQLRLFAAVFDFAIGIGQDLFGLVLDIRLAQVVQQLDDQGRTDRRQDHDKEQYRR